MAIETQGGPGWAARETQDGSDGAIGLTDPLATQLAQGVDSGTDLQIAQAAGEAASIGQVTASTGAVVATRLDGTEVELTQGDPVFQGDSLTTADDGAVSLVFLDGTSFDLGGDATIVIDQLIYNPETGAGEMLTSVVKGTFIFLTGTIAGSAPDAMKVNTPSGTIGIRGTRAGCAIESADTQVCSLLVEDDGSVGVVAFIYGSGEVLLTEPYHTVFSTPGSAPILRVLSREAAETLYSDVIEGITPETEAGPLETEDGPVVLTSGGRFIPPDLGGLVDLLASTDVLGGVPVASVTLIDPSDQQVFLVIGQPGITVVTVEEEGQGLGVSPIVGTIPLISDDATYAFVGFTVTAQGAPAGAPLTSGGELVTITLAADGQSIIGTLPPLAPGDEPRLVFTLILDPATGNRFIFTLFMVLDHFVVDAFGPDDTITLNVTVQIIDPTPDDPSVEPPLELFAQLIVVIEDSHPTAVDDPVPVLLEGAEILFDEDGPGGADPVVVPLTITGNVLANDDQGADNHAVVVSFTYVGGTALAGSTVVTANGGTLTVLADGSFTYVRPDNVADDVDDGFTYTIRDFDGDTSSARQSIIVLDDDTSVANSVSPISADLEARLPGGSDFDPDNPFVVIFDGLGIDFGTDQDSIFVEDLTLSVLDHTGSDLPLNQLTSGGQALTITQVAGSLSLVATLAEGPNAGDPVFIMLVDEDGSDSIGTSEGAIAVIVGPFFRFELFLPLDHFNVGATGTDDSLTLTFEYTISDGADSATGTITITLFDDGPAVIANATQTVHESALAGIGTGDDAGGTTVASGTLGFTTGADGATITALSVDGLAGVISGANFIVTGAFYTLTVNRFTGDYSYSLTASAPHAAGSDLLTQVIRYTVTDGDSDSAIGTLRIRINDDVPHAVADANQVTASAEGAAAPVISGNVIAGDGRGGNADVAGADGIAGITWQGQSGNTVTGLYGTLTVFANGFYRYDLDETNAAVIALQTGDPNLQDLFTYTIVDDDGDTSTTTLTVTITGANEAPVITIEAGDSAADTLAETDTTLSTAGTLTVSDQDTTDLVAASVLSVAVGGNTGGGAAPGNAALLAMMTVAPVAILDATETTDVLTWSFGSGGEAFDYLAVGESLILTYTVQALDDNGAADTQAVVITITGTNDGPVIGVQDLVGGVTEGDTVLALTDSGTIAFTDLDLSDSHTATPAFLSTTHSVQLGALTSSVTTDTTGTGLGGVVTWNYSVDDAAVQFLAAGETIDETYRITLDDGNGGVVIRDVVVTITGTNDAPVITDPLPVVVSEEGLPAGDPDDLGTEDTTDDASGQSGVTASDLDATDLLTFSLGTPDTVLTSGGQTVVWSAAPSGTITGTVAGAATPVITISIDGNGDISVVLSGPIDHAGAGEDDLTFTIPVIVTDDSGAVNNTDMTTLSITIEDDQPVVVADSDLAIEGGDPVTGNVLSGAGSDGNAAGGDTAGADGFAVIRSITLDGVSYSLNSQGGIDSSGSFTFVMGVLTVSTAIDGIFSINMTGETGDLGGLGGYSYTPPVAGTGDGGNIETVAYVAEDGDGDTAGADLVITVEPRTLAPLVTVDQNAITIQEDGQGQFTVTVTAQGDDLIDIVTLKGLAALLGLSDAWGITLTGGTATFSQATSGDDIILTLTQAVQVFSITVQLTPPADSDRDVLTDLGSDLAVSATTQDGTAATSTSADLVIDVDVDADADAGPDTAETTVVGGVDDGDGAVLGITLAVVDGDDDDATFQQEESGTLTVTATFDDASDGSEIHTITVTMAAGFGYILPLDLPAGVTFLAGESDATTAVFLVSSSLGITSVSFELTVVNLDAAEGPALFSAEARAVETLTGDAEPDDDPSDPGDNIAVATTAFEATVNPVFPSGLAYTVAGGSGGSGEGGAGAFLYALDLESGVTEQVGPLQINNSTNLTINGLALDPLSGFLFGFGGQGNDQAFIRINPVTGEVTVIGPTDNFYAQTGGLSFTGAGVLWAVVDNEIGTIDVTTGLFTSMITLPSNQSTDAFAVSRDGSVGYFVVGTDLFRVELVAGGSFGDVVLIGQIVDASDPGTFYDLDGLSFDDNDVLFGADNAGVIVRIDPETATSEVVSTIANNQVTSSGLSTLAISVVDPGTYLYFANAADDYTTFVPNLTGDAITVDLLTEESLLPNDSNDLFPFANTVTVERADDGALTITQGGTDIESIVVQNDDDADISVIGFEETSARIGGGTEDSTLTVTGASRGELAIGVLEENGAFFEIGESDDLLLLEAETIGADPADNAFTLYTGAGDDSIVLAGGSDVSQNSFTVFAGSGDSDTLTLATGVSFDQVTALSGVEIINLDGADDSLSLSAQDVLDISDSDILTIAGDSGDSVNADTPGDWTFTQQVTDASGSFNEYEAVISATIVTLRLDDELQSNLDGMVV